MALVVVCLAQLMNALDGTIVNVALPSIQHDLLFSQANLTWVINAYLITFGSFLLLAGRLGDLIGRKRVFLTGIAVFTAASAACALAPDQAFLIGARFVQGLGSALSSSVIVAIIVTGFPQPAARARAMGTYVFVAVGGGSIGLLVGGLLTQAVNWHLIFLINLPIGLVAFVLGAILIEENQGIGLRHGVDVVGSVLITAAMMSGIYAIVGATDFGWVSAHTLGFGALGLALLAAFLLVESRLRNPIMPLRVLRLRTLMGSSLVRGLATIGLYSSFFMGTIFLERVLGFGPTVTGLAFLPFTLTVAILSRGITARVMQRFGPRATAVAGLASMTLGLLLLSRLSVHSVYFPALFVPFLLMGLGGGLSFMPLLSVAMTDVPAEDAGLASGIVNVSMQVAAAIGVAALGTISAEQTQGLLAAGHSLATALTGGFTFAFTIAMACVAVGILMALLLLRTPASPEPARELATDGEMDAAA